MTVRSGSNKSVSDHIEKEEKYNMNHKKGKTKVMVMITRVRSHTSNSIVFKSEFQNGA